MSTVGAEHSVRLFPRLLEAANAGGTVLAPQLLLAEGELSALSFILLHIAGKDSRGGAHA